eukprot:SAG31_NODE_469_length_15244_cov_11.537141_8_plen_147_part_00
MSINQHALSFDPFARKLKPRGCCNCIRNAEQVPAYAPQSFNLCHHRSVSLICLNVRARWYVSLADVFVPLYFIWVSNDISDRFPLFGLRNYSQIDPTLTLRYVAPDMGHACPALGTGCCCHGEQERCHGDIPRVCCVHDTIFRSFC